MRLHERREVIPRGFVKTAAAPASQMLNLRLALVQSDPQGLEDALYAVSTPSSALYGQFLTKEEVEAFVAPKEETVELVTTWLAAHGLTPRTISPAGDWLAVDVSVAQANELFAAEFATFTHVDTGKEAVRTLEYSIPASLQGHLDLVHPTTTFPTQLSRAPLASIPIPKGIIPAVNLSSDAVPASCNTLITPACLQALYGIPTTLATQSSNKLGVSGFIDQFANSADLRQFLTALRPDLSPSTSFTLQTLDGGTNTQTRSQAGIEADLDTQYTIGVASGVPTVFISVGDNTNDGVFGFLDIINFLLSETSPPQVLTTSYGADESDVSRSLANNLCNAYAQLGARGTSIFFSSGDGGVSGGQSQSCTTFIPPFPAGCPFITTVGATTGVPETAADFSSGGFSNYFGTPSYQTSAHATYLNAIGSTNSGKFNASGRGFPDVSAMGENVEIVWDAETGTVAGTSCSSPIFASVVALLNDELIAAGKSPLGFLNPFLYSTGASALNDITTGNNPGCNTNGFSARAGWDPVTGLGTPNFAALRTAVGL
ncbi:serine protease S53 [Heterobasidion irregulare TC 32-1]|uniref:tripeptidyl-peptidase II n=1 Tax=Heterobasidion irregulare (strain TC 32-1) TaxID=747525 RepID=W4KJ11_HETIT|nr:serine protease S53 [Heterobasidion irregulare TC 32-1]ETW85061.1 serine protease S53 [Heterobasidion irregulare TC 32-1]